MALAHQGNWDHAGAWSTLALARVTTVAERLRPEELYLRFLAFRESLGMEILPLGGGDGRRSGCWSGGCGPAASCRCWPTAT